MGKRANEVALTHIIADIMFKWRRKKCILGDAEQHCNYNSQKRLFYLKQKYNNVYIHSICIGAHRYNLTNHTTL